MCQWTWAVRTRVRGSTIRQQHRRSLPRVLLQREAEKGEGVWRRTQGWGVLFVFVLFSRQKKQQHVGPLVGMTQHRGREGWRRTGKKARPPEPGPRAWEGGLAWGVGGPRRPSQQQGNVRPWRRQASYAVQGRHGSSLPVASVFLNSIRSEGWLAASNGLNCWRRGTFEEGAVWKSCLGNQVD